MKKSVLFAAIAASTFMMVSMASCSSCGDKRPQGIVVETETDSLFMLNDSTVADLQTLVYEGFMPMENGNIAECILTITSLGWDQNGTYTILSTFSVDTATIREKDRGKKIVQKGTPKDSTAVVYHLVSDNKKPTISMVAHGDSVLTGLNSQMQPLSDNPKHKLVRKN